MSEEVCVNRICVICSRGALQEYTLPNGLEVALCEVHQPTAFNAQEIYEKIREVMGD